MWNMVSVDVWALIMFSVKEMTKDIFPCSIHRVTDVHWYSKRKRRAQVVCIHKNSLKCAVPFPTKLLDKPRLLALVWSQPGFQWRRVGWRFQRSAFWPWPDCSAVQFCHLVAAFLHVTWPRLQLVCAVSTSAQKTVMPGMTSKSLANYFLPRT